MPSRLPTTIQPDTPEAQWLAACWETALAQAMNVALENLFDGVLRLFKKEPKL